MEMEGWRKLIEMKENDGDGDDEDDGDGELDGIGRLYMVNNNNNIFCGFGGVGDIWAYLSYLCYSILSCILYWYER